MTGKYVIICDDGIAMDTFNNMHEATHFARFLDSGEQATNCGPHRVKEYGTPFVLHESYENWKAIAAAKKRS